MTGQKGYTSKREKKVGEKRFKIPMWNVHQNFYGRQKKTFFVFAIITTFKDDLKGDLMIILNSLDTNIYVIFF